MLQSVARVRSARLMMTHRVVEVTTLSCLRFSAAGLHRVASVRRAGAHCWEEAVRPTRL